MTSTIKTSREIQTSGAKRRFETLVWELTDQMALTEGQARLIMIAFMESIEAYTEGLGEDLDLGATGNFTYTVRGFMDFLQLMANYEGAGNTYVEEEQA